MEAVGVLQFWTFMIGVVVIILMPGPNSLFVLKTSLSQGRAKAWQALSAVLLGDAVLIFLSYLGVASLLLASPQAFSVLRYLGAAYLLYMGMQILLSLRQGPKAHEPQAQDGRSVFYKSLLLSLTNPKAILFYLSFFIQFIDNSFAPSWVPYLVLALSLEAVSLLYLVSLVYAGGVIARFFVQSAWAGTAGNLLLGLLFMGFSVSLAFF